MGTWTTIPAGLFDTAGSVFDSSRFESYVSVASDSMGIDDSIAQSITKTLADDLAVDDSIAQSITKTLADDLAVDDSFSKVWIIIRSWDDSLSLDDPLSKGWIIIRSWDDSLSLDDPLAKAVTKILTDDTRVDDSEDGLGDLIHASGNWTGHRYFNLGNLSPYTEVQVDTGGWTKTTMASGASAADGWTKKTIGV